MRCCGERGNDDHENKTHCKPAAVGLVLTSKDIDSMTKAIDSYEGKDKAELNFSMTENIMKIEFNFPASVLTAALEALLTGIQNSGGAGTGDTDTPVITFEDFV